MNHSNLIKNKFNSVQVICCQDDEESDENKDNNILINDDLNEDLIDFANIPSTITEQQKMVSNYSDSTSSTSSLSSSSTETLPILNVEPFLIDMDQIDNQIDNKNLLKNKMPTNEFEIIKSIENLLYKYKWSAKFVESDCSNTLIECESCEFILSITNFVKKFKAKLDICFNNINANLSKTFNSLINFYLIKLIHFIFFKHECNQSHNNDLILFMIKNFFKQINKSDTTDAISFANMNDANFRQSVIVAKISKIKKQLNDFFSSLNIENNSYDNQPVNVYNCAIKQDSSQDLIDCCQLNEEDPLLTNLDLIEDDPVNPDNLDDFVLNETNNLRKQNDYSTQNEEENFMPNYSNNQDMDYTKPNQLPITSSYSNSQPNDDNSSILKAINKRKLHLTCPICGSSVVNMSDHLVKKHSIRDRNQRKYLMDLVRKTYINETRTNGKESEQGLNKPQLAVTVRSNMSSPRQNILGRNDSLNEGTTQSQSQPQTNSSNRKFIKCPICLDDNKFFVNISDHLIKIHHLVTSESRKPILKQIKENSLNYSLNKSQFDIVYSKMNQQETADKMQTQLDQQQLNSTNNFNFETNVSNNLLFNETKQISIINDIFNDQNENEQLIDTNNYRTVSKRKPLKSKKLTEYSLLEENNHQFKNSSQVLLNQDDEEDDDVIPNNIRQQQQTKHKEEDDDEDDENWNQDDDSDYYDLIALNYDSLTQNNMVQNNINEFNNKDVYFELNNDDLSDKKRKQIEPTFYNPTVNNFQAKTNDLLTNKAKRIKFSNNAQASPINKLNRSQINSPNYDLMLLNESVNFSSNSIQDFELNDDSINRNMSRNQKFNQQLNKITPTMSPNVYTCTSPSSSSSKEASTSNRLNNSNNLDTLWSKFNSIESSLNKTVKCFNLFSDNLIKQIQTYSNQFQTALNELDSFKKCLIEASGCTQTDEQQNEQLIDSCKEANTNSKKIALNKRLIQSFSNQRLDELNTTKRSSLNRTINKNVDAQVIHFGQQQLAAQFNQDNKT